MQQYDMALARLHQVLVADWTIELEFSSNALMEKAQVKHIVTQSRSAAARSAMRLVKSLQEERTRQPKTLMTLPALQVAATAAGVLMSASAHMVESGGDASSQSLSDLLDIISGFLPACKPAERLQAAVRDSHSV
jgi:hypothetical protein